MKTALQSHWMALLNIAILCIALYCTEQHFTAPYCTTLHCTPLQAGGGLASSDDWHWHCQSALHTANCTLHTAHCTLHTAHCTPQTANCKLQTANFKLHTAHCTLYTEQCTLHTAHCPICNAPQRVILDYSTVEAVHGVMAISNVIAQHLQIYCFEKVLQEFLLSRKCESEICCRNLLSCS